MGLGPFIGQSIRPFVCPLHFVVCRTRELHEKGTRIRFTDSLDKSEGCLIYVFCANRFSKVSRKNCSIS